MSDAVFNTRNRFRGVVALPLSHIFRDVFLCRLIVIVQRSHLRACTFNDGPAVGDPNCGQSVADDHAMMPESIRWFLGCTRSTSPE